MNKAGLPGTENLSAEEVNKEVKKLMRRVFSTEEGKLAFNILLTDLHYFNLCENEEEQNLCNFAKRFITERMGIVDTIDISNNMLNTDMEI